MENGTTLIWLIILVQKTRTEEVLFSQIFYLFVSCWQHFFYLIVTKVTEMVSKITRNR
jgi:hypothetical protein